MSPSQRLFPDHPPTPLWLSRTLPCFISFTSHSHFLKLFTDVLPFSLFSVFPYHPAFASKLPEGHVYSALFSLYPHARRCCWVDGWMNKWMNEWMSNEWTVCFWNWPSRRTLYLDVHFPGLWDDGLWLCEFRRIVDGLLLFGRKLCVLERGKKNKRQEMTAEFLCGMVCLKGKGNILLPSLSASWKQKRPWEDHFWWPYLLKQRAMFHSWLTRKEQTPSFYPALSLGLENPLKNVKGV